MQNVNEPGSIWGALQSDEQRPACTWLAAETAHRYAARAAAGNVYAWHLARLLLAHLRRKQAARELPQTVLRRNRLAARTAHLVSIRPASSECAGAVVCAVGELSRTHSSAAPVQRTRLATQRWQQRSQHKLQHDSRTSAHNYITS